MNVLVLKREYSDVYSLCMLIAMRIYLPNT
jgi:hypothetical protein